MSDDQEESSELAVRKPKDAFDMMEDIFEDFRRNWMMPYYPRMRGMRKAFDDMMSRSKTDLVDNGDSFDLHLDVPGIPKDKLSINVTEGDVEVSGAAETRKEEERKNYLVKERGFSKVYRRIQLPEEVIPEKAEATVKDGVLMIKLPKKMPKTEAKAHKVVVS